MAMRTTYLVQPFERKRGRLAPGRQEAAMSEHGAIRKAEALASRMPGAAAIKVVADAETGDLEGGPVILAQYGEVPEDFAESLQG